MEQREGLRLVIVMSPVEKLTPGEKVALLGDGAAVVPVDGAQSAAGSGQVRVRTVAVQRGATQRGHPSRIRHGRPVT